MALATALAHPLIARLETALAERAARQPLAEPDDPRTRWAAVALLLRVTESADVELLLIKRAAFEGDPWSGHIALPGGRAEPEDANLLATAIRETREETAIDLTREARVLGALDPVRPRTPSLASIAVAPFVAVLGDAPRLVLSSEVADAFWVPLIRLQDPASSRDVWIEPASGRRRVSSFQHGGHTIWGLTERILRQALEIVAARGPKS